MNKIDPLENLTTKQFSISKRITFTLKLEILSLGLWCLKQTKKHNSCQKYPVKCQSYFHMVGYKRMVEP